MEATTSLTRGATTVGNHRSESALRSHLEAWRYREISGAEASARARAKAAALRLIPMGDWCALRAPTNETPSATNTSDGG